MGVVSSAVYASFGHQVIGLDVDAKKISSLQKNKIPFFEPNLEELLTEQQRRGSLHFTTDYKPAIKDADVIIIAVGTPSAPDGQADLKYIFASAEALAPYLKKQAIVVVKSTVPPNTLSKIVKIIKQHTKHRFYTASLPEFLREGSAVSDTLHPDRIIIGASDKFVFETLEELHRPFKAPILKMKPESAQMAKYSANAYLATRITFINHIADLCEKNGADIQEVIEAIGHDKRIGEHYWYPGLGYGGSCFPKDVMELAAYSRAIGESDNLLNRIDEFNQDRISRILVRIEEKIGGFEDKTVAVLGLSFKPNTDDMRQAPAAKLIPILLSKQASVRSFDPLAKWNFKTDGNSHHQQFDTIERACQKADIIMALIEWPQIISYDFSQVRNQQKEQWFIDARNQFDPTKIKDIGFKYFGIGRS